ncbi:permease-like cell division protein FtsX [Candidatus Gracilibacteria bacterium]|nr:permease-like cell division protein FtsX [Candidatus Gracilibacteria bacterium]MCF7856640.1 permease-like cell division protein FtsX [Candidatus Gracilibacteria bacterium]MCF7896957.1 permease-like cell division protein FtsX [Candidatus Gracilibacteria bacterium]
MIILLRILRIAGQNIWRNGLTSLVAILVITLLFVIFNGILFANSFQKTALDLVNSRLDLALNFTSSVDDFQVGIIENDLRENFPEIREINFISSETAFVNFVKNFGQKNRQLSTWLKANTKQSPLPATLIISADADLHEELIRFLDASRYGGLFNLDTPATGELAIQTANKIIALDKTISRISLFVTLIFVALAVLIIIAVLRLAIFARGMEIGIMRLVGATRQFIRLPFILEGIFFGFAASSLGAITFFFTLEKFNPTAFGGEVYGSFGVMLATAVENFSDSFVLILGWQILAAIAIGTFASLIATHRYLTSHEVIFN